MTWASPGILLFPPLFFPFLSFPFLYSPFRCSSGTVKASITLFFFFSLYDTRQSK
ncbi:hypothetical protein B0F90DRAFT_1673542 [Multifurca ochricompacta]|uniref:Uncharacterized protein n=1 Tax=Multifurca ochricompacta TaxID=376703 RepID=A0AAD4MCA9_9AGAM|nr:hypothetical protein B0F90DRAFT_1673542 [Multifurca ochricompacta]